MQIVEFINGVNGVAINTDIDAKIKCAYGTSVPNSERLVEIQYR